MVLGKMRQHLELLLQNNTPIMLLGAAGVGKSSLVKQVAKDNKWDLIDLRLSLLNPIDLRGLPFIDSQKNKAVWLSPEFLPDSKRDDVGILFLDEINVAPISVQQAAYQLLLDRRIGEYVFPEKWKIVAAGNREGDQASVQNMPAPLINRLILVEVEAEVDDWAKWAKGKVDDRVISFLKFKPNLLSQIPKKEEKAFPSPRSWEVVSKALIIYEDKYLVSSEQSEDIDIFELLKIPVFGSVGEPAGTEFLSFLRKFATLPDIDAILAGQVKEIPKKADVIQAVVVALAERVNDQNLNNVLSYIFSLQPEYAMFGLKTITKDKVWRQKIQNNNLYIDWMEKNYEFFK